MKITPWLRVTSLLLAVGASAALAQPRVPYFGISGDLRDSVGNPVNAPTDLVVRLYDSSAAPVASALHVENFPATPVTRGQFQLQVGTTVALQVPRLFNRPDAGAELWVGIQVSGEGEMSPRLRVNSAPWALSADWSGLTSVPASFPPGSHQHPGTDVTSAVANANNVPWTGVSAKPATFPPSAHQHPGTEVTSVVANASAVPWGGITGRPATFPPTAHQHPGTDVTSAVANASAVPWAGVTGKPAVLVTGVTASAPLASSGGATPNLTLGTVGIANGGTGSTTQNFVDLSSNQTIGGNKNFTRVGIGVAAPANELEIASTTPAVVLNNTAANYGSLYFREGATLMSVVQQISPTYGTVARRNTLEVESITGDVVVRTGGAERLRVEASGLVGIGLAGAAPAAGLHVARDLAASNTVARFENASSSASSFSTGVSVTDNGGGRTLELGLAGTASTMPVFANHQGYALVNTNGTPGLDLTTTNGAGVIRFFPAGLATERMRLTSTGRLGIGTATPASQLDLAGGCMTGTLCSDARMKSNIRPLREDVLSRVMKLEPSTFEWKGRPEQKKVIGVIAQQVETVFPEVVGTSADGAQKGIECTGLTAIALKAIQEQQVQLKAQQAQIDALQRKLEVLSRSRRER